ncbi:MULTISPECIES: cytochrome c oxidase subunit II [unclassified Sphingobium]|uniref:cytochrome c oxidase subunit II n=1 Tax=unclassified Sphingobium TaxID=2611147 RepID=UPI002225337A|nr:MULTISPECIES: cytochrome c oxidase subunit II [unclassified Sphingobium]MCW2381172.1 cytochrome c oxidase subunit II [Sphingobium sp. B2D3B]MCW2398721.1 cytochrome c oxidase subunit II [Sphingobium sp. B2D3C]
MPGAAFFSSGCAGRYSTLEPAGPAADAIASLWWVMLAGAVAILVLVCALLALAFRRGSLERPTSAKRWIIGGGLIFPSVVLVVLLAYGLVIGERLLPRNDAQTLRIVAEASRWQWTFTHPGRTGGVVTQDVLNIPAGRPVDVELWTRDVIHAFWVPRLAGKMDAIPGHRNVLRIEANVPGVYHGLCAEFCGPGHTGHAFRVVAHDEAGWARFVAGEGQ